jgi:hypothetical protein
MQTLTTVACGVGPDRVIVIAIAIAIVIAIVHTTGLGWNGWSSVHGTCGIVKSINQIDHRGLHGKLRLRKVYM